MFRRQYRKGSGKRGHLVAETLLLMTFPSARKLGNICCGHKMFLNKIRNIFCVRARANGETFVSATMCPRLPVPSVRPESFICTRDDETLSTVAYKSPPRVLNICRLKPSHGRLHCVKFSLYSLNSDLSTQYLIAEML